MFGCQDKGLCQSREGGCSDDQLNNNNSKGWGWCWNIQMINTVNINLNINEYFSYPCPASFVPVHDRGVGLLVLVLFSPLHGEYISFTVNIHTQNVFTSTYNCIVR